MTRLLQAQKVHIIGIGGAGMSPLARILLAMGKAVSGSDLRLSPVTASLSALGAHIYEGHSPEHVGAADLVVITSAAKEDNPEIQAARQRGIPVVIGSDLLGGLMDERQGIAVAGTHGKTTTTAMIALILERAGLDPTIVVGGEMRDLALSGKLGRGPHLVAEADEYDERFLQLRPAIAVVTNVEADHLDFYGNMQNLRFAFRRFVERIQPGGWLVACGDDAGARELGETRTLASLGGLRDLAGVRGSSLLYGLEGDADWRASDLAHNGEGGYDFMVSWRGETVGSFRTIIPGRHNVQNALAAIAVARLVGIEMQSVRATLSDFHGAGRRFELKGEADGVTVIDDYAHHPTEIRATLAAARERYPGRRIVAVHQPHTFSRLRNLLPQFAACFGDADVVLICDIYPARETDSLGVHSQDLVAAMDHPGVRYAGDLAEAAAELQRLVCPGDVVLTLGAGPVNGVGEKLLEREG